MQLHKRIVQKYLTPKPMLTQLKLRAQLVDQEGKTQIHFYLCAGILCLLDHKQDSAWIFFFLPWVKTKVKDFAEYIFSNMYSFLYYQVYTWLFFPKISDAAFCASPGVTTCAISMSGNVHQQNSQRRSLCASSIIGLMKSYFIFWGKKKNYCLENNSSSVYP